MATEEHLSDKKNDYKKIYEKYKQSTKEDLFFFPSFSKVPGFNTLDFLSISLLNYQKMAEFYLTYETAVTFLKFNLYVT